MGLLGGKTGTQRLAIQNALGTVKTGRSTPTHDAYKYALDKILLSDEQKAIRGEPYLLLITDGAPSLELGCFNTSGSINTSSVPTTPIVEEVTRAATLGVKTFIIGSPGSEEAKEWLSAAATAGGTAKAGCSDAGPTYCHMDMTTAPDFSAALRDGLSDVATAIVSCKYKVPTESADGSKKVDPNLISPVISYGDGKKELVGIDTTGACAGEGFKLNSATELELCPSTCTRFQSATGGASLQLMFGCSTPGIIQILQ
jgi:hypothetical protein